MKKPHLQVKSVEGRFWVKLVGANGETMMSSELYSKLANARRASKRLSSITGLVVVDNLQ